MPEVISPCPACGGNDLGCWEFVVCKDCGMRGPLGFSEESAITAWNALPRMSTIIAWQLQAAGAALAMQRLMDAAQTMREAQQALENLIGVDGGTRMQAACKLCDAEDAFDDLLAGMLKDMEARHDPH